MFFNDDQTFSGTPGYHTVVLKGTAIANQGNSSSDEIAATIRDRLAANGYPLIAARVSWNDGFGGYLNSGIDLEFEIAALDMHTAEDVRRLITDQLVNIIWTGGLSSTYSYLRNVALRVESDDYVTPSTGGQVIPNPYTGLPNANVNPNRPNTSSDPAWDNFWKGLGLTAAPSAAVLALGAVALIVIMRK